MIEPPRLRLTCQIDAELGPPMERGTVSGAVHRIIPIIGGTVSGERISGRVLNLGADWQMVHDSHAELDTRYGLETDDGALIDIRNFGLRHGPPEVLAALARGEPVAPEAYYMRTHPRLHSADPRYAWVNRTIFLGTGERYKEAVRIGIFEVL
ncbi:DUF3237 domain-containing protein [Mesobaculum littorinae]|uniref:UPF0311 protein EKE94_11690 n=1 Tax=Mesobaculum littorinae TaxID=2486419 RepID=A0A438AHD0_9RHOB|nr:DUF3237 domain-containing protein [Mesobaculum littorinae]RVV98110.1 DUF3237 domain-containing protein [Mesobaculum littorinae]